jgi:hypothetical protein
MGFDLSSLPRAVIEYLQRSVTIGISDIDDSTYPFTFQVSVSNASEANGGIALTNVRYQVGVPALAGTLKAVVLVPDGGESLDAHGQSIQPGTEAEFFTFNPADADLSYLHPGGSHDITFAGRRQQGVGAIDLEASILADPDINALFPRNFKSSVTTRSYTLNQ